ncbi:hypothetical protein A6M21_05650 [Desulfotomaculum copahuensis]|uniref:AMP-dependent synthetase/ligase domain-containing protein n=1 Tax=Desulfotomaculum copahuensis TaxID=1838280 RepID=A0A1B7LHD8_9FIRM|nr:hypothetical protein A6M21_05650 [Desulfotomaculum copahuensis]
MNTGWPWVVDLLAGRSSLTPGLRAVYDRSSRVWYTFKDLNFRANKLANYLKDELGLVQGDRVAILAHNRIECFDLFFATQKTNIISFPLNVRLSSTEMDELLAQAEPRVLCFENALEEKAASLTFPFETKVRVGTAKHKILETEDYEAILQSSSACAPQANHFSFHDTHLLLSTGGTTGLPKLAMSPHRMVYMNIINEIMSWNITGGDSATIVLPLFHTGGWHLWKTWIR